MKKGDKVPAQVYFRKPVYFMIKDAARAAEMPVAAWIRETVEQRLVKEQARPKKKMSLLHMQPVSIPGLPTDLASNLDAYLYGDKSKYAEPKKRSN